MKNDKKSLLQQLYDGDYSPWEQVHPTLPGYLPASQKAGTEIEALSACMSKENQKRFDQLLDLLAEIHYMENYAHFSCGFRSGMQLMRELAEH